ncbi:hypothetical protein ES702_01419 [subsurface metagenome]
MSIPTPKEIYCPKCGVPITLESIEDSKTRVKLEEAGYITGARGTCPCGVTAVLAMKKMPANPTFTLMFNIYKLDIRKEEGKKDVS